MLDNELEHIWNGILSKEGELIISTYNSLDEDSKIVVLQHLKRMVTEEGWHPKQVVTAQTALNAIEETFT